MSVEDANLRRFMRAAYEMYAADGVARKPGTFGRAAGLTGTEWTLAMIRATDLGLIINCGSVDEGFQAFRPVLTEATS